LITESSYGRQTKNAKNKCWKKFATVYNCVYLRACNYSHPFTL